MTRRGGFTLVEGLLAAVLAGLMLTGVVTFFGDFLQRFTHQDDTLSGAHEAQLLMEWLRRDVTHADGRYDDPAAGISSASETGTTFPKYTMHACHVPGGAELVLFPRVLVDPSGLPPPDHPVLAGRPPLDPAAPGAGAVALGLARFFRDVSRVQNGYAWVAPADDARGARRLIVNVRKGTELERIEYVYDPPAQRIVRHAPDRKTIEIASPALQGFHATPYLEVVHDPQDPGFAPRLVRTWLEVEFSIRARQEGKEIASREVGFSTRLFPVLMNEALRSDWNP